MYRRCRSDCERTRTLRECMAVSTYRGGVVSVLPPGHLPAHLDPDDRAPLPDARAALSTRASDHSCLHRCAHGTREPPRIRYTSAGALAVRPSPPGTVGAPDD